MAFLSHLWDFFFYFKIRCVTITGKGLAGSRAVGGNYLKKRFIIILAVISLAFFVISYLLPQRIGGTDYTGVYTDAGLYGTQENVEVKKTGNIYTLRIKPLTDDDEYVNVEFSPDKPGEMVQIDDHSRCRVYMFNNSMCIQTYIMYEGDYYNGAAGELENSYSSGEYELYSLAYMVKMNSTDRQNNNYMRYVLRIVAVIIFAVLSFILIFNKIKAAPVIGMAVMSAVILTGFVYDFSVKLYEGRYEAEDSITKSYLNDLDDVNRLYCMDIVKADRTGNKYYIVMFNTSRSFPDIYVAHTKDGELITDTEVEDGFADFNTYRITRKFGKYHMYWKGGNEWFTMRIDKKYEKGFAVRHITEYIAAVFLGLYIFIFIKSLKKAGKEKEEEKRYEMFGRYRCVEVTCHNEVYEDFAKHLTENVTGTEITVMPDSFEIFGNRYDNVKYEYSDSKKHHEIPEIQGKGTEVKIICGDEIFYYVKTSKEIFFGNTLNGNVLLLIKALQEEKSYGS